jgi:hypothetical protein
MANLSQKRFVICVRNDSYPASLEKRKIYEALRDADAAKHDQIRVVDESGEDYLYPDEYFVPVSLPKATREALAAAK